MTAFYNEIDPYAAAWLRNLIAAGHIASGVVDERSIADIAPEELHEFTQLHFFAGIGGWPLALRRAGWPDDRPVCTASCPCQPFSAAGAGLGFDDERHLWPACFHHIEQLRPPVVFGEQVASKAVDEWVDLVQADLEALGYAFGAIAFPSAGVGAPHIRDRCYWVADAMQSGRTEGWAGAGYRSLASSSARVVANAHDARLEGRREPGSEGSLECTAGEDGLASRVADTLSERHDGRGNARREDGAWSWRLHVAGHGDAACRLEHASSQRRDRGQEAASAHEHDGAASQWPEGEHGPSVAGSHRIHQHAAGPLHGPWRDADWLLCRDGRWRPVEPGTFPLAHGVPGRVGRLRAYGNAINVEAARVFIETYLATQRDAALYLHMMS